MSVSASRLDDKAREDNRIAANWLLWCGERRDRLEERRQEIIHSSASGYDRPSTSRERSAEDPTANRAIKLAALDEDEKWLKLIDEIEAALSQRDQIFLRLRRKYRRRRGRHGWTAAVQWEYPQEMARRTGREPKEFWVEHRNTFTQWWGKIVEYTVREAIRKGLL